MTVYLVHLDEPMSQGPDPRTGKPRAARHYVGFAEDVEERFDEHVNGRGSRMLQVAVERGITLRLARVWPQGDRNFERLLHRQNNSPRLCPYCNPDGYERRKKEQNQ